MPPATFYLKYCRREKNDELLTEKPLTNNSYPECRGLKGSWQKNKQCCTLLLFRIVTLSQLASLINFLICVLRTMILTWFPHLRTRMWAESIREKNNEKPQWKLYSASNVWETVRKRGGCWHQQYRDDAHDDRETKRQNSTVATKMKTIRLVMMPHCDSFSHWVSTDFILDTASALHMQD